MRHANEPIGFDIEYDTDGAKAATLCDMPQAYPRIKACLT